jgi:Lrp/AsnC family transcriptional regulator, regulator for asnA, asnC and gidA
MIVYSHMELHNNNKNPIDEIDQRIIEALQQDGRRPFTKIAADLGISEASVRQRVSNLINNQVMQIVAVTNPIKLGFSLASMIGIRVAGDRLLEVAQEVSAFDEVIYLILCTGSFDMLAEVVCRDNDHLLKFLTEKLYKVVGVQQAETYMYLRVYKQNDWAFLSQARVSPSSPQMRSHVKASLED